MSSLLKHVKTLKVSSSQHNKRTYPHTHAHVRNGSICVHTSCLQLPGRPSRCVRARPPKVNGRMTLWWSGKKKVFAFYCIRVPLYLLARSGVVVPRGMLHESQISLLFIMPSRRRESLPLCSSRYTSRPVSFKWKQNKRSEQLYLQIYRFCCTSTSRLATLWLTMAVLCLQVDNQDLTLFSRDGCGLIHWCASTAV